MEKNLSNLIKIVGNYNKEDKIIIEKAYNFAENLHKGQVRQSGDAYITHPLEVAFILAQMHADTDTICAALLHDTLEDCDVTKEEIIEDFNEDIANLVEGVTKISKLKLPTKEENDLANTRKILISLIDDVRIIIIKLADRVHNQRTLQFKSREKQIEKSLETMEIFVPLAFYIGAYKLKTELENLSFMYLEEEIYDKYKKMSKIIEDRNKTLISDTINKINNKLITSNVEFKVSLEEKSVYEMFKRSQEGDKISKANELFAIKILVNEKNDCYKILGLIHEEFKAINHKFKDYISNPKTNMYQSIHTSVFISYDKLIQIQIRTYEMDSIADFGLCSYWDINKLEARKFMQNDLRNKYQFFSSLAEMNDMLEHDADFVEQVKNELFSSKVYVYSPKGDIIELPKGSTPIDYAYKINTNVGDSMIEAFVNAKPVPLNYTLKNNDLVSIETVEEKSSEILNEEMKKIWQDNAFTNYTQNKINEIFKD